MELTVGSGLDGNSSLRSGRDEFLHDLLTGLVGAVACFDASGRLIGFNSQYIEMFHRSREQSQQREKTGVRLPDGNYVEIDPKIAGAGNLIVLFYTDSTRRHYPLNNAEEAKKQFISVMSHELRTPLSIVRGLFELIGLSSRDETISRFVEKGILSADQLLNVIDSILDFSAVNADDVQVVLAPFELGSLLEGLESLFVPLCSSEGSELRIGCDPDLRSSVFLGSSDHLRRVLFSLISNSLKFGKGEEIMINVNGVGGTHEMPLVEFSVADRGVGMTLDQQSRLFQPFTQLDMSSTRRYGGIGLDLALSQRLVSLMGGDPITVESQPGVGSRFTFRLSLQRISTNSISRSTASPQQE